MPVCSLKLTKAFIPAVDGRNKYYIKEKHSFMLQVQREGGEEKDPNTKEGGRGGRGRG